MRKSQYAQHSIIEIEFVYESVSFSLPKREEYIGINTHKVGQDYRALRNIHGLYKAKYINTIIC